MGIKISIDSKTAMVPVSTNISYKETPDICKYIITIYFLVLAYLFLSVFHKINQLFYYASYFETDDV